MRQKSENTKAFSQRMKLAASKNMVNKWLFNLQLLKERLEVTKAKMKGLIRNFVDTIPGKIHQYDTAEDSQKLQLLKETVDNIAQNKWRSTARIPRLRRTRSRSSSRQSKTGWSPYRKKRPSWRSTKRMRRCGGPWGTRSEMKCKTLARRPQPTTKKTRT